MIRIRKPPQAPAILSTDGTTKLAEHCALYSANPTLYQSRQGKFVFAATVYAHPTVKQALEVAQHRKCCYCETFVGTEGEVEHFRPKAASKQAKGSPLIRPGYYWLVYDWDNLFLSCHSCNALHKGNLFPLQNSASRARNHTQSCANETPLLVHPVDDDPQQFISFRAEIPYPLNARGKRTISLRGLQSERLNEERRAKLKHLQALENIVLLAQQGQQTLDKVRLAKEAKQILANCTNDDASFAGMARANGF